eukprot:347350_1
MRLLPSSVQVSNHKEIDKFYKIMLRMTNLVIITVVTSFLTLIVYVFRAGEYWYSIDHVINVLCIYLSFGGFSDRLYNILCWCTERYYYKCCAMCCFCCCMPLPINIELSKMSNVTETNSSNKSTTTNAETGTNETTTCTRTTHGTIITDITANTSSINI